MINLRYHIVSITAVFLALGIGVVLGSTFLDRYTVDQLDRNISSVEERITEIRAENEGLRADAERAEARQRNLRDAGTTQLFTGLLTDVPVVLVTVDGIDEASTQSAIRAVASSGAVHHGTLTVTANFNLDEDRAAALSETLGLATVSPASVRRESVRLLAEALSEAGQAEEASDEVDPEDQGSMPSTDGEMAPPDGTTALPPEGTTPSTVPDGSDQVDGGEPVDVEAAEPSTPDIVNALIAHELLSFTGPAESPDVPLLSGTGHRYVFLSGSTPVIPDEQVLFPMLRAMAADGPVPAVVASAATGENPDATRDAVVGAIRDDELLVRSVSSVDDLESFNGIVSMMLALDQAGEGVIGHYGEGEGITAPLPVGP